MVSITPGLTLASAASLLYVATDVFRKKSVTGHSVLVSWFWMRTAAGLVFLAAFLVHLIYLPGPVLHLHPGPMLPALNGGFGASWPQEAKFCFYLLIDGSIVSTGLFFYLRALKSADFSFALPFISFTPVLLIPTSYILLHELPVARQILGVMLVVLGSFALNGGAFREGPLGPIKALYKQPASRYMFMVSVCFSLSNPLDKMIVTISDPTTAACGYGVVIWVIYAVVALVSREHPGNTDNRGIRCMLIAGTLDAFAQLLQFGSLLYTSVVLTITLKRAGIILAVPAGWFLFHEKEAKQRLPAVGIMFIGVLLIYLRFPFWVEILLTTSSLLAVLWKLGRPLPAAIVSSENSSSKY